MHELGDYFFDLDPKFQSNVKFNKGTIGNTFLSDDIEKASFVLIGLAETRNAINSGYRSDPDVIRDKLYQLSSALFSANIFDLGNLKSGKTLSDTYVAIEFVVNRLLEHNKIPIIFGGSHDVLPYLIKAQKSIKEQNVVIIDSRADIDASEEYHSQSHLQHVINNVNVNLSLLAQQNYFISKEQSDLCQSRGVELLRLGLVRNQIADSEPFFRDADIASIDMTSVRFPDFQASSWLSPNGLYAEEICQLANFAGMSDRTVMFHIAEYESEKDSHEQSAHLVAQIIWHIINGLNQRKGDYPKRAISSYKKIYVNMDKTDVNLVFYKNEQNNRFWIEIPKNNNKTTIMSCSENDYRAVCNNSIPGRISRKIAQYLK